MPYIRFVANILINVSHYDVSFFLSYLNESGAYGFKRCKIADSFVVEHKFKGFFRIIFRTKKEKKSNYLKRLIYNIRFIELKMLYSLYK